MNKINDHHECSPYSGYCQSGHTLSMAGRAAYGARGDSGYTTGHGLTKDDKYGDGSNPTREMMFKEEDISIEQGYHEDMYWVRTKSLYTSQAEAEAAREALLKIKK